MCAEISPGRTAQLLHKIQHYINTKIKAVERLSVEKAHVLQHCIEIIKLKTQESVADPGM